MPSILDTSTSGLPMMAGEPSAQPIPGVMGADNAPQGPQVPESPNPNAPVFIEIELAPGAAALGMALSDSTAAAAVMGTFIPGSALSSLMQSYRLQEARPVFDETRVKEHDARVAQLRTLAAIGGAAATTAAVWERLPSPAQFVRLQFPPGTSRTEVTAALKKLPEVMRAVPVPDALPPFFFPQLETLPPADPLVGSQGKTIEVDPNTGLELQWYLHRTKVPEAWKFTRGVNVVIADIDWGFRVTHEDLSGNLESSRSYNSYDGGSDVTQGSSAQHGTAVLGIAGATANDKGISGYAPEARLWAVQGNTGSGVRKFQEPWVEAIDYVRRTDAGNGRRKVIILEVQTGAYGNYEQLPSVAFAIRTAIADGCVVCVAAGNGGKAADRTDDGDPFDPTGSILVGATAYHPEVNRRASFSNFGARVVVSAPGDPSHDVTCGQVADNAYRNNFGGTSGATPKVAGTVALMLSANPALSHDDVRDILAGTGTSLMEDAGKPIGVFLNAEAAVAEAMRRRVDSNGPAVAAAAAAGRLESVEEAVRQPRKKRLEGIHRRTSQQALPVAQPVAVTMGVALEGGLESAAPPVQRSTEGDAQPTPADKLLRNFRATTEGVLNQQDRIFIVEQAILLLDNFYVHRPLKEAMHAVRPIQRLRVLLRRLQRNPEQVVGSTAATELEFHNTITEIFNSVRDLHTNYQLPRPFRDFIAFLPFEVAPFYDKNDTQMRQHRFIVTRVVKGYPFAHEDFGPGAEILYWNGMAISRAVEVNAEETAGGNDAARRARGVSALTIRAMNTALPPDADFVDLQFVPKGVNRDTPGAIKSMRQHWFVRYAPSMPASVVGAAAAQVAPPPVVIQQPTAASNSQVLFGAMGAGAAPPALIAGAPAAVAPAALAQEPADQASQAFVLASVLGLDVAADSVREARQLIFEAEATSGLEDAAEGDEFAGLRGSASPTSPATPSPLNAQDIAVQYPWNSAIRAGTFTHNGILYGHIRINTFYFEDADRFVQEIVRLLTQMPSNGLVLDVRGNGGGNIWAAERLLQTLTATPIEPERMQFIVSSGTLEFCRNNASIPYVPMKAWVQSLEDGVETGSVYSLAYPLTDAATCNSIGQRYYGPVVLVVDGNCYSATDIFAAGFQDHGVGRVIGVSRATGAGGANVWDHATLTRLLPPNGGLKPLPSGMGMRVALRQCLRVGPHAGALLEDFGVVPDQIVPPTREDLVDGDVNLLAEAANWLKDQPQRRLGFTSTPLAGQPGQHTVTIEAVNVHRVDLYVDGRPKGSFDLAPDAAGKALHQYADALPVNSRLRFIGFDGNGNARPVALHCGTVA